MRAAMRKATVIPVLLLTVCMSFALAGCQPRTSETAAEPAVKEGSYEAFSPSEEGESSGGKAIEGSEEEKLQQERIAGGAVGAVVSKNLEPLEGITDYTEGAYSPAYGYCVQPPSMGHVFMGEDCVSCHESTAENSNPMPESHVESNLENTDCVTCHPASE